MNVDDVVFSMDESCRETAMRAASVLRKNGRRVDVVLEDGKKSKWTFKHAERVGAKRLLTIGKKEQEEGKHGVTHRSLIRRFAPFTCSSE